MSIDFEEIKDTLDRSWTDELVSILETAPEGDPVADDASDTLSDLVDPAVTDHLFAIATDPKRSDLVRSRFLDVIFGSELSLEGDALRAWWSSGDPLLQKVALQNAYRTEADYLKPVVQDPLHPFHREAVSALEVGFDDPEWQPHVVKALSHFDPAIQKLAAKLAIWEEPISAEARLIELANGSNAEVALESIKTLSFYLSRASLRALSELTHHHDEERAQEALEASEDLATRFYSELEDSDSPLMRSHLMNWMQPVFDIVAIHQTTDRFVNSCEFDQEVPIRLPFHGQQLQKAILDVSGKWAEKMRWLKEADWSVLEEEDRKLLSQVLTQHVDPVVRMHAARILAEWNDVDGLLVLIEDKYSIVRQQAIYRSESISPNSNIAEALRPLIERDLVGGWAAKEVLGTFLRHAPGDQTDFLVNLALNDSRLGLRWTAINELGEDKAELIVDLLNEMPQVHWDLHSSLLDNLSEGSRKRPDVERFFEVDNLSVAVACAKFS